MLTTFKRQQRRYENRLFQRCIPSQNQIIFKKHPNFVWLAKKYFFFLAKKMIFKFCLLLSRGTTGGLKPFILMFYTFVIFSGKKFDFRVLLFTFKKHPRRYENRLFKRSIPSQYRIIYKKTPKIRFASKKKNSGKKFDFRILLSYFRGLKTIYFYVLSHLSNDLSTKTPKFRFTSKYFFLAKKNDSRILLFYFKVTSQEV